MNNNYLSDLRSLQCPVCIEYMIPPINQCTNQHPLCHSCFAQIYYGGGAQICPSCREPLVTSRNNTIEAISEAINFPCKFEAAGCTMLSNYQEKQMHENECSFRPFECPISNNCKWVDTGDLLAAHIRVGHATVAILQGPVNAFLLTDIGNILVDTKWIVIQQCFGTMFKLTVELKVASRHFTAVVQTVSPHVDSDKHVYKLELSSDKRELTYKAMVSNISDYEAIIAGQDCFVFTMDAATKFAPDGNLVLLLTIVSL